VVAAGRAARSADFAARGLGVAACILIPTLIKTVLHYHTFAAQSRHTHEQKSNRHYLRDHYGDDIDTASRTYISLIKYHSLRTKEEVRAETKNIRVILVGANEEAESRIQDRRSQAGIDDLLFVDRRFIYPTITAAMQAAHEYCRPISGLRPAKTLFVFLLISPQNPTLTSGPQHHETFHVPGSLRYHHYAIVGTGTHNNVAAHKLCGYSTGPNKERLLWNLPMGPEKAGVMF